jgi:uncharacterized membrane protein
MAENPYAAPRAHVEDAPASFPDGEFIPGGRGVPAGNGWRWIADAWAFTGLQRGTFIGVFLLWALIAILMGLIPILGSILSALIMPVITAGFILGCDAVRRGQELEVAHLFAGFKTHAGKLIALGAIYLGFFVALVLIVIVIFGSTVGMLFLGSGQPSPEEMTGLFVTLMLAALVMLALSLPMYMAMWFACPLIVLAQHDVGAALKTSFGACLKNIVPFLIWSIAIFFLSIVATIPLALGWLLLGPVLIASIYLSYRDIFHEI